MKKHLMTGFYILLTITVCAAGFLLPSALIAYQDNQIFAKIEHSPLEPMELTYSSSLLDTLQMLSVCHVPYYVDYPASGSSRTEKEVYQIVKDILDRLEEYGIFVRSDIIIDPDLADSKTHTDSQKTAKDAATYHSERLQLAIASDESVSSLSEPGDSYDLANDISDSSNNSSGNLTNSSGTAAEKKDSVKNINQITSDMKTAVVWQCTVYFQSGCWLNIWIHDKSGKAVAFTMYTEQSALAVRNKENLDSFTDAMQTFVQDYYELPAELVPLSDNEVSYPAETIPDITESIYKICLKDETSSRSIEIPFTVRAEYMTFN